MNKLTNLEVIAKMANLRLGAEVFHEIDNAVVNFQHYYNPHEIRLTEDVEKKVFKIHFPKISMLRVEFLAEEGNGVIHTVYSNQEAVDVIVNLYTTTYEN